MLTSANKRPLSTFTSPAKVAVPVTAGADKVLLVKVSVVVLPTKVSVVAGSVRVMLPLNAECAGACSLA